MRYSFYFGVLITLAIILIGWWGANSSHLVTYGDRLVAIGRLFGLLAAWSVIIQIILMSRIPFIERNFDLQENIQLHKYNGYALLGTISGHIIFLTLGYALPTHIGLLNQIINFNTQYEDVLLASIGTAIFFVASFLSLYAVRSKMRYELWYFIHITVYLGIFFTFLHQINTGGDFIHNFWFTAYWYGIYILAFVLWLRYRILNIIFLAYKHGFRVNSVFLTAANTYSITLTGRNIRHFKFQPGQYAVWRFLSNNLWYEAHPFSISSPQGSEYLQFTVKASPSLTDRIANVRKGTYVMVDGPRGSFTAERAAKTSKVVLIAGGIGVAPYISTIEELLLEGKDVTLMYSARRNEDLAFRNELTALSARGLKIQVYITDNGQQITSDSLKSVTQDDTTVYICGPDGMSRAFMKILKELGFDDKNIITERFAF